MRADKATILVVEDDRALRDGLVMNLQLHGFDVLQAVDGEEGLQLAFNARPDLIILDIMLPKWSGLEILDALRKEGEMVPVLMLSARGTTTDKVTGLELGADDYLAKPFDIAELLARVGAMLRRRSADLQQEPLQVGRIAVDVGARSVRAGGKLVELSAKEFDLFLLFVRAPKQVFTREAILQHVWGWDYEGTERTVDNFVANLRKKIGERRGKHVIVTVPKVGYRLGDGAIA